MPDAMRIKPGAGRYVGPPYSKPAGAKGPGYGLVQRGEDNEPNEATDPGRLSVAPGVKPSGTQDAHDWHDAYVHDRLSTPLEETGPEFLKARLRAKREADSAALLAKLFPGGSKFPG